VTRVECDVGREMMLNKEILVKGNRGWARSGLEALASPIQPWYARNITPPFENSCSHECRSFACFLIELFRY